MVTRMTFPRSSFVHSSGAGSYHLISRCVRRAFLCGDAAEHRRQWLTDAIRLQSTAFCVDVLAYAIMANHLHIVVTTQPDHAVALTALEIAERWAILFPLRDDDGNPLPPAPDYLNARANDAEWIATRRARLSSVSWYMKLLKERIARRANAEDHCTGHFWEGRFTSVPLLDQAAVTACMAYVDLNPIRAKIADRPEISDFTSVQARIINRENERKAIALADVVANKTPIKESELTANNATAWLAPLHRCVPYSETTAKYAPGPLSLDDYLTLVDETGRLIHSGKRGFIPPHLAPILERLDLDFDTWLTTMCSPSRFLGGAIGSATARAAEALRRGVKWVVDRTKIHKPPPAA
jgi:REP element-mobilizing transposase RayT